MMNILVLNGSPKGKRSNTYQLTKAFLRGICGEFEKQEAEGPEITEIEVSHANIRPCLGCFSCWNKTPGKCCIQDDVQGILEKMLWADLTIWSFPLYYFNVPGSLKSLIDRQLPMSLPFMTERADGIGNGSHPCRYDLSGKRTVLISTCGFYTAEENYGSVLEMFDHICGKENYTAVFCGQGELFRVPELSKRTGEYLEYVRQAGQEYIAGGITADTREKLSRLLYPKEVFERMADASWGIDAGSGEKEDPSLTFTRQMAALYQKEAYSGTDLVLEMRYTDVGKAYQILLTGEGSRVLTDSFREYTTCVETPLSVWQSIAAEEIRGDEALMQGKYRVLGDVGLMMNWDRYFGGGTAKTALPGHRQAGNKAMLHCPDKNTTMLQMLLPWTAFWVAASIDSFWGALASLAVCVLTPLLFHRCRKTIYDTVSLAVVGAFALASAAGAAVLLVVPASYFAFGVMWSISCLFPIPLTAHYSMNSYNGEEALENPIFIKTNRILTALWGILYLVTPVWTYFIMKTEISSLTGAINSIAPILMGFFTGWFQKWYPERIMRGK